MTTQDCILSHCARYPLLRPTDLLKFLHQSTFGPGHLVSDAAGGLEYLRRESAGRTESITAEPLDGDFYRLHLGSSLSCDTLWNCFRLSSRMPRGTAEELEQRLSCACGLAADVRKFPHHGLVGVLDGFYDAISPDLVIMTAREWPNPGLAYLQGKGAHVLNTWDAPIRLRTDGQIWVVDTLPMN